MLRKKIWELAKDERNKFAIQLIRNTTDTSLFETGAVFIDEIEWSGDDELEKVVRKLCENGAVKDIYDDIASDIHTFSEIVSILTKFGDKNSKEFISGLLDSLSREDWLSAIESDNRLIDCVPDNNANFGKAWSDYFKKNNRKKY